MRVMKHLLLFSAIRWLQLSRIAAEPGQFRTTTTRRTSFMLMMPLSGSMGSDPDGAGPAIAIGYDAFPTIQGGVNAVAATGTVNVAGGNYFENVTVNKAATLRGANVGNPPREIAFQNHSFARSVIKVLSLRSHPTTSPSMALRLTAMIRESLRFIRSVAVKILILCMV